MTCGRGRVDWRCSKSRPPASASPRRARENASERGASAFTRRRGLMRSVAPRAAPPDRRRSRVGMNMPWHSCESAARAVEAYEWPSAGSRRPLNDRLGAASREERAGSDRKSGELQTMPFSQETAARIGAGLLDRRQWNIRKMRHIGLRSVVKTRTLGERRPLGDIARRP